MPIILIAIGGLLIATGIIGNPSELWALLQGDFTGPNNFIFWVLAILILGSIGYVKELQGFSRTFLALVIVVLFLHNKGFFAQFQTAVNSTTKTGA